MKKLKSFLLILIHISALQAYAQHNISSIFVNDQKKADKLFVEKSYFFALKLYEKVAYEKGPSEDIVFKIATCLFQLNNQKESEEKLAQVIKSKKFSNNPKIILQYADVLYATGKKKQAIENYEKYLALNPSDLKVRDKLNNMYSLQQYFTDSLTYSIFKLNVNSDQADFAPYFYNDRLIFLSNRGENAIVKNLDAATNRTFLSLYECKLKGDSIATPAKVSINNSKFHEGPFTLFNNKQKIIFTKSNAHIGSQGLATLQMFEADFDSVSFNVSNVKPMPFNNSNYSVSHPTFQENNNTLYFASNMPGGVGGTDIYGCSLLNGSWSQPKNLGPAINTDGNEMFPYFFKNFMMCFASDGRNGLGGLDVFYAMLNTDGFTNAINVGYPINTTSDDFGLVFSNEGNEGFFSSNRKNGKGSDDIYRFKIKSVFIKGQMLDKLGKNELNDVAITLLENGIEKETKRSDASGKFLFTVKPGRNYEFSANREGYKNSKMSLSAAEIGDLKEVNKNFLLERKNKSFVKVTLKDESQNRIPNGIVKVYDRSKLEQTLTTDANGEVRCEVDADVENTFVGESKGFIAAEKLKIQRNKKGSMVLNIELELKDFREYKVEITLKSERTRKPLPGFEAVVKNMVTGESMTFCSDKKGRFDFKGCSYATYDIGINFGTKISNVHGLNPKQNHALEIFWNDKQNSN